jgi:DNA methylase
MADMDFLRIPRTAQTRLIAAARDGEPVQGLTHGFYKYPARFSPTFARAAIKTFTKPGQLVLDPHVGGGTTLVEARASGREAVGVDRVRPRRTRWHTALARQQAAQITLFAGPRITVAAASTVQSAANFGYHYAVRVA